jgi:hypothetical protein
MMIMMMMMMMMKSLFGHEVRPNSLRKVSTIMKIPQAGAFYICSKRNMLMDVPTRHPQ